MDPKATGQLYPKLDEEAPKPDEQIDSHLGRWKDANKSDP